MPGAPSNFLFLVGDALVSNSFLLLLVRHLLLEAMHLFLVASLRPNLFSKPWTVTPSPTYAAITALD